MTHRARHIGLEHAEQERQTEALNESLQRDERRRRLAGTIAEATYGSDEVTITGFDMDIDPTVHSVDGGYWVEARLWVEADAVEERMGEE